MLKARAKQQQTTQIYVALAVGIVLCFWLLSGRSSSSSENAVTGMNVAGEEQSTPKPTKPVPNVILQPEMFIPANKFSSIVKKPLDVQSGTVSCPERGGKNAPCGKVPIEYRFQVKDPGDYFLYIQVVAPSLNDNSLWVELVSGADEHIYEECQTNINAGPLIPHKHVASKKTFLCCPAYLAKNKKKGLASFYSDCCYGGLGKDSNEKGCVLDLEVDTQPRWNQLPRVFRVEASDTLVSVRVFAREDGTSWTGLVLSSESALDESDLGKLKRMGS